MQRHPLLLASAILIVVFASAGFAQSLLAAATTIGTNIVTTGNLTVSGNIGVGSTSPSAYLALKAGTASVGNAPLKFTSGALLTTPETGAFEFDGVHYYGSIGSIRYQLDRQASIGLNASKGILLGDSTIIGYAGQNGVDYYLLTDSDSSIGVTVNNQAVAGNTILQQQTIWTADANKMTYDWIVVEVGLNDLNPAESAATALGRYQTLIDTINAGKKASAVIVIATMTPAKQRLIDIYGAVDGLTAYQKWLAMNTAIMGGGSNKITGVHYRVNKHTAALNDGNGNLASAYDTGDHIHENNLARGSIASAYREVLNRAGFLTSVSPVGIDTYWSSTDSTIYPKNGSLSIGYTDVGTAKLAINGNVGIGTTSPSAQLYIQGNVAGDSLLKIENTSGTGTGYSMMAYKGTGRVWATGVGNSSETYFGVANKYFIYDSTGNAMRMTINTSGFVGIGTTTPYSKFHVTSGASATTTVNFGEVGSATSKACFNTKNTAGADVSFYFVGTTMVVESNLCR